MPPSALARKPKPAPPNRTGPTAHSGRPLARPAAREAAVAIAPDAIVEMRGRGRGAQPNASGRYEPLARVAFDDGWQSLEDLPPFKTTVQTDATRKIITRND